jgi:hypothetical protein
MDAAGSEPPAAAGPGAGPVITPLAQEIASNPVG